jgi:hypothetical protein
MMAPLPVLGAPGWWGVDAPSEYDMDPRHIMECPSHGIKVISHLKTSMHCAEVNLGIKEPGLTGGWGWVAQAWDYEQLEFITAKGHQDVALGIIDSMISELARNGLVMSEVIEGQIRVGVSCGMKRARLMLHTGTSWNKLNYAT